MSQTRPSVLPDAGAVAAADPRRSVPDLTLIDHRIPAVWHRESPNVGGALQGPRWLVMHYTAGDSGAAARDWLCDPRARASAHFVVARDGAIWQIVPCDRVAWHAGQSSWRGESSLNRSSLGIEIANRGWLRQDGDAIWRDWAGHAVPAGEVCVARHKAGGEAMGWQTYPADQLAAVTALTRALLAAYPTLREVVGHDDISPGRKLDPGPAFPLARFQELVADRGKDAAPRRARCTARLNIRSGPGTDHPPLRFSPLAVGTEVALLADHGRWRRVALAGDPAAQGWVHGHYLAPAESGDRGGHSHQASG